MKPLSIQSLLFLFALLAPSLQAQHQPAKVREIEQKVLRKQYQTAIDSLVGSARESKDGGIGTNPELIGKRLQWLTLLVTQIEAGGQTPVADEEDMSDSAGTLNELAWDMVRSPDAGKRHPEIALKLAGIAIELAGKNEKLKPMVLDTKARALFLLGKHGEAIAEQEKAIAAATVEDEKAGFEATLAAYKRNELPEVVSPAVETADVSSGVAHIMAKLRTIVIPRIEFEDTTLEEAIDFLRKQAAELDTTDLDPSRKGVNFVIRRPTAGPAAASGTPPAGKLPNTAAAADAPRIKELRLRNVPLAAALKYICEATRFRYKVDDFAVTLVSPDAPEDLFTRSFGVPRDFASKLNSGSGANPASGDPKPRPSIIDLLKSAGIHFGEGSSATLTASGTLLVTNTPSQLDKVEQLIQAMMPAKR